MLHAESKAGIDEDVCVMITADNHKGVYLFDCGSARELTVKDCRDTVAIFISHTHIDHFANFDGIMRHQLAVGRKVVVCGPPGLAFNVHCKLRSYTWNLSFDENAVYYEVREIHPEGHIQTYELHVPTWEPQLVNEHNSDVIYDASDFAVRPIALDHGTPSIGYLFEEPSKLKIGQLPHRPGPWVAELKEAFALGQHDRELLIHGETQKAGELFDCLFTEPGYKLGLIMDHAGNEANHELIADHFRGVDELIIECYYSHEDLELALINNHSTAKLSGLAAKKAEAKSVTPLHFSRRYNAKIKALEAQCFDAFER